MGLLLREFYKHCSFLPFGLGSMAGEAFASGQNQWASGEELLLQINVLSSQNKQLPPLELALGLQAHYFKTVVCIPLEKGGAVLEIGTTELVPKNDASMIYGILGFINGLTQGTPRGDQQIMSSSFEAGTKALPNDAGNQYADPDEQYKSAEMMKIDGGRVISRHLSITRSYRSLSSTSSSSTPSASDQMGNSSNTTFVLNTSPAQVTSMNNEDMLMSPASCSLQATPISMVNSFDELHILNQFDHIDMHGVSEPICLPEIDSYGMNNDLIHFPHDHHLGYLSAQDVGLQGLHMPIRGEELLDSQYLLDPHSEPDTHHNHLLDCVLQPMQCAFSCRNDAQVDTHHCLDEIVRRPNMACQTEVTSISCLPSVTCQASSHPASSSNDNQDQQWRGMFPSINEGERMTDLFGQSERHAHAMVSADISKIPLAEDSLGDKRLGANINDEIMQEQGAALMIEDEGSTSKSRKLIMGTEGYEAFIGGKMSNDKGGKMVVSSTVTSAIQAAGRYVSYASGSAEADKVIGSSTSETAGSYVNYAAYGSAAEAYKVVGLHGAASYVSYASGSAEGEKVAGSLIDHYKVQQGTEFLGLQQLQRAVQQDDQYIASTFTSTEYIENINVNPSQVHHVQAERTRRRKQGDCINTLRTLLPNITKKQDKARVLESTIQHIKELEVRIHELEQEKNSRQEISSQENATCDYVQDTMPHFRLTLIKNAQDVKANATIIEIMDALQKKNLYCFDINLKFLKSTSKLSFHILANYKDGGNSSPKLDDIQHIKQWWEHLIKD